jgi:two-component system sensor histidine kinase HydH
VLLRDRKRATHTTFAAFTFMVSAWHLCTFVALATGSELMRWLALWPAATIVPTALAFFRKFLSQPAIGGKRRQPRATLAWTIAAYVALLYSILVAPIHDSLWFQVPFGIYVYGGLYRCMYDMYEQYRETVKQTERTRLRYLIIGGFAATTLAIPDALPAFGIDWPTLGNVLTIIYLYFLSETLVRVIHVNELVGKMAVLGTLVVLLWAVYGFLLTWIGGGQKGLFLLNAIVSSFVIFILYEPARKRLETGIHRWITRQRAQLRGPIVKVRGDLIGVTDTEEMARRIIAALEESRRVTHASVYLLDSTGSGFDLKESYGQKPIERVDSATYRAFLDELRQGDHYLDRGQVQSQLVAIEQAPDEQNDSDGQRATLETIAQQLKELEADLVFPMFGSESTEQGAWLLGLLVVRDERVDEAFDEDDDIKLFQQLAQQAAKTIENSREFEEIRKRERLAGIGEMATGLAHEIRNPLSALKGAAQIAADLLVEPDGSLGAPTPESAEFLRIIIEEVDRLNNVVTRFLEYARMETNRKVREHDVMLVNHVVRETVKLLENHAAAENIDIEVHLDDLIPPIAGDPDLLKQVFLNLGINALHAMEKTGGTLEIKTTRRRLSPLGYGSYAEIRFRDTGMGIPADRLADLFVPFSTTKEGGTGLGLAISQRIVDQHGGTIEVRSTPGKGSTFAVFFPALGPSLPARAGSESSEVDSGAMESRADTGAPIAPPPTNSAP